MPAYIATQGPLSHTISEFWQVSEILQKKIEGVFTFAAQFIIEFACCANSVKEVLIELCCLAYTLLDLNEIVWYYLYLFYLLLFQI